MSPYIELGREKVSSFACQRGRAHIQLLQPGENHALATVTDGYGFASGLHAR